jgi:hypothetical protein
VAPQTGGEIAIDAYVGFGAVLTKFLSEQKKNKGVFADFKGETGRL